MTCDGSAAAKVLLAETLARRVVSAKELEAGTRDQGAGQNVLSFETGSSSISIVRHKGEIACKWMGEFFCNQFNELWQAWWTRGA
jgi:hypothetical protein